MIRAATLVVCALVVAFPAAQSERVMIRRAIAPNQTIHVRIASEWDYENPSPGPRKLHTGATAAYTLVTGAHREGERYEGRITFDEASVEITIDGQRPSQEHPLAIIVGKPMTATYDAQGRFQDLDVPFELSASTVNARTLFMNGAFTADALLQRWPPAFALGIGDSIEIPSEVALPIAGMDPAVPGGRRLKLLGVEPNGQDRIAKLQQTFEGMLSGAMIGQDVSLSGAGSGTIDWNIDRGFATAYDINFTLDASRPSVPPLHHTVHTHMTASN